MSVGNPHCRKPYLPLGLNKHEGVENQQYPLFYTCVVKFFKKKQQKNQKNLLPMLVYLDREWNFIQL